MIPRGSSFHPRGWTLVELVMVLALTGGLALSAYPSFDRLVDRLMLRSASVTLVQTLRTARHLALTDGRAYTVSFEPADRRYRLSGDGGGEVELTRRSRFGAAADVLGPPSQPTRPAPADGVTFRDDRVSFQPDGTLSPGPGTIYLTSGEGAEETTLAISLNMAGHLRRYRWEGGTWRML